MATLPVSSASSQSPVRDRHAGEGSRARDLAEYASCLDDLRQAMRETGWTIDALAAHFDVDRSYVTRMLDADKPFSLERTVALPDDLEARFYAIRAERMGAIVVQPLVGVAAQKAFVAGLVGLMSPPELPAKADRLAKADLPDVTMKARTR